MVIVRFLSCGLISNLSRLVCACIVNDDICTSANSYKRKAPVYIVFARNCISVKVKSELLASRNINGRRFILFRSNIHIVNVRNERNRLTLLSRSNRLFESCIALCSDSCDPRNFGQATFGLGVSSTTVSDNCANSQTIIFNGINPSKQIFKSTTVNGNNIRSAIICNIRIGTTETAAIDNQLGGSSPTDATAALGTEINFPNFLERSSINCHLSIFRNINNMICVALTPSIIECAAIDNHFSLAISIQAAALSIDNHIINGQLVSSIITVQRIATLTIHHTTIYCHSSGIPEHILIQ